MLIIPQTSVTKIIVLDKEQTQKADNVINIYDAIEKGKSFCSAKLQRIMERAKKPKGWLFTIIYTSGEQQDFKGSNAYT